MRVRDLLKGQRRLRVLSVRVYPALAIAALGKDHENRSWYHGCKEDEWVAIHASQTRGSLQYVERALQQIRPDSVDAELALLRRAAAALSGRIVAVARFAAPVRVEQAHGWKTLQGERKRSLAWPVLECRRVLGGPARLGQLNLPALDGTTLSTLGCCVVATRASMRRVAPLDALRELVESVASGTYSAEREEVRT